MCVKIHEMLFKNWKLLFENTNQTPPKKSMSLKKKNKNFKTQKLKIIKPIKMSL